ncbi:hypothetical protein EZV62_026440 [Acer yangbiense]|uniref:Gnk2-homologous domain-containing protein n=1 Tax=Acer yangbiense TaxID=1000413 RepID=A0A5C7GSJ2_9ROSI|nr:hypothetical protein EZV62_026440 [Acer yangbiense]
MKSTTVTDINSKRRSGLFMPIDEALVDSFSWLTTLLGLDNEGGERGDGSMTRNAATAYPKPPICFQRVAREGMEVELFRQVVILGTRIAHFYGDPAANSLTPLQPSPKPQPPTSQEGLVSPPPSTNTAPQKAVESVFEEHDENVAERWFYEKECSDCLSKATDLLPTCCYGRQGGRVVSSSCNFRYEIAHFYSDPAMNSPMPLQPSPKPQSPTSQEGLVSPPPPATNTAPWIGNLFNS